MKVHTTISIDEELITKAKELDINLSGTINRLLKEHYKVITKEEIEREKQREKEQRLIEKKREKLEEIRKNFFVNNPEALEEDFDKFMESCSIEMKIKCGLK